MRSAWIRWRRRAVPILLLVAVFGLWELGVLVFQPPAFILPAPSAIALQVVNGLPGYLEHAGVTMVTMLLGFGAGSLLGIALAIVMDVAPPIRNAVYPLVIGIQTTPKVAIAPLLIIWFGVGLLPKVIIVALLAFFPVLINTLTGLQSTNRGYVELLDSVRATRWQGYRMVRLPSAVPFIFAGLKLALTVSAVGAVVAEWVSANAGLGFLLIFYNARMQTVDMFAVLAVLVAVTSAAFGLLVLLERWFSWDRKINVKTSTGGAGE